MKSHDQIPEIALRWIEAGRAVALATVVRTWGSAPRPVGAQLAIAADDSFQGSVSGGCIEGAIIVEAQDAIKDGQCRILEFGISDQTAFEVGLACGGEIEVMIEPVGHGQGPTIEELRNLVAKRLAREPVVWEVNTDTWTRRFLDHNATNSKMEQLFRADRSSREGSLFRAVYNPPLRLVIVGAVHIAQPLVQMAKLAGYDVALCDPRQSFSTDERFPGETFLDGWPDEALTGFGIDARTAVVALSHDPKIDQPALEVALKSEAFYIGALGSKRTHLKRISALESAGYSVEDIGRLSGPVGLNIGAASPAEIAVSIIADMTARLRQAA